MNEPTVKPDVSSTTCERCHEPLNGKESYDLWILVTKYDEYGECAKTSMSVGEEDTDRDYISIGIECCGHLAMKEWNEMVARLLGEMS